MIDKPVGVAVHPSPGWTGPTVVGGLAAAGYRISTSGAAERQGVVHRLDVGTTGVMVVAASEHAYTVLKRAFKERTVDKDLPRDRAGPPGPEPGHHRRPDRPAPQARLQVRGGRGRQAQHHPLRGAGGVPGRVPGRRPPGNRAHPPDPRALRRAASTRASATSPTAPTRPRPSASASPASGCTPARSASIIRPTASGCSSPANTRPTCRAPSTSSATPDHPSTVDTALRVVTAT